MDYKEIAKEVEKIVRNVGKRIMQNEYIEIEEKGDAANLVTNLDLACQRDIIKECTKLIPQSCFYAEEEGLQQLGEAYTWVIDPIDGTTNFAYDFKHSCISVALLYQKKGVVGVVYNPYLDECFVGVEGMPSTCNGKYIQASDHDAQHALVLVGTSPYYKKELADKTFDVAKKLFLACRDIRRSGSAALDMCYVAAGRADAYYEAILSPWDYAAGLVIAAHAQVKAIGLNQAQFDYTKPMGVLLANPVCFDEIREMIGE